MKKIVTFLALSVLFLNTAHGQAQQEDCCSMSKNTQEATCFLDGECTQQFLKGFAAGAIAGLSVEYLLPSFKNFTESWHICNNTGICRDQLAGEAKVVGAVLGLTAFNKANFTNFKKTGAQLLGVIVGACAASYATKLLTPAAAPVAPAQ